MERNDQESKNESELSGKELYEYKRQKKLASKNQDKYRKKVRTGAGMAFRQLKVAVIVGVVIIGLGWYIGSRPLLPTTSQSGHVEESPESHVMTTRMPDKIQRHMLEHADGTGAPGIIIQYNCEKYECEEDLVENLTTLVENDYPGNVYLAPNIYDGKIILTKEGSLLNLDEYDEEKIRGFIGK